jgi:hypothetical protein
MVSVVLIEAPLVAEEVCRTRTVSPLFTVPLVLRHVPLLLISYWELPPPETEIAAAAVMPATVIESEVTSVLGVTFVWSVNEKAFGVVSVIEAVAVTQSTSHSPMTVVPPPDGVAYQPTCSWLMFAPVKPEAPQVSEAATHVSVVKPVESATVFELPTGVPPRERKTTMLPVTEKVRRTLICTVMPFTVSPAPADNPNPLATQLPEL